jgi:hypothetical protein
MYKKNAWSHMNPYKLKVTFEYRTQTKVSTSVFEVGVTDEYSAGKTSTSGSRLWVTGTPDGTVPTLLAVASTLLETDFDRGALQAGGRAAVP